MRTAISLKNLKERLKGMTNNTTQYIGDDYKLERKTAKEGRLYTRDLVTREWEEVLIID